MTVDAQSTAGTGVDSLDGGGTMAGMEWISVSERLPEEDEDVLVMTAEGKFASGGMHVASLDEDGVWYPSHGDGWEFPDVTHWMPLPEPPEVK